MCKFVSILYIYYIMFYLQHSYFVLLCILDNYLHTYSVLSGIIFMEHYVRFTTFHCRGGILYSTS